MTKIHQASSSSTAPLITSSFSADLRVVRRDGRLGTTSTGASSSTDSTLCFRRDDFLRAVGSMAAGAGGCGALSFAFPLLGFFCATAARPSSSAGTVFVLFDGREK